MTDLSLFVALGAVLWTLAQPLGWLLVRVRVRRCRGEVLPWSWRVLLGPWAYFNRRDRRDRSTSPPDLGAAQ